MTKISNFKTTEEIKVPLRLIDQVIGQDHSITIVKKVAKQHRHLLLIGQPGVGKSLVGQALAELLPKEKLVDILSFHNEADENVPLIKTMPKGKGKDFVQKLKIQSMSSLKNQNIMLFIVFIIFSLFPWWAWRQKYIPDVVYAASLISTMIFLAAFILFLNLSKRMKGQEKSNVPKLLVDNSKTEKAPFIDGTGAQAGALLGDCLHDPFQSLHKSSNILTTTEMDNQIQLKKTPITNIDHFLKKYEKEVVRKENYQAVFLPKEEISLLGEKDNQIESVEVLSVNKYLSEHPHLIKITTESGKELIVTPEHKVAIKKLGKIIYKEAKNLTRFDKVVTTT